MKAGKSYIKREELEKIVKAAGCNTLEQAGFIKVTRPGTEHKLYISKQKSCARVDLSGFLVDDKDAVVDLGGESFGAVHQQLRFDRPPADIAKSLSEIAANLAGYKSVEKAAKGRPAALKGSKKLPAQTTAEKIVESAEKNGGKVAVSVVADAASVLAEIKKLETRKGMMEDYAKKTGGKISEKSMTALVKSLEILRAQLPKAEAAPTVPEVSPLAGDETPRESAEISGQETREALDSALQQNAELEASMAGEQRTEA